METYIASATIRLSLQGSRSNISRLYNHPSFWGKMKCSKKKQYSKVCLQLHANRLSMFVILLEDTASGNVL